MNERSNRTLEELTELWRSEHPPAAALDTLRRKVARETRTVRLAAIADLAIVLTVWPVAAQLLDAGVSRAATLAIAALWLVNAAIAGFALWNRRGAWSAAGETPHDYVALTTRRARARLRTARFVPAAATVQAVAVVLAVALAPANNMAPDRTLRASVAAAVLVVASSLWAGWYGRRARADLSDLARVSELLADEDG